MTIDWREYWEGFPQRFDGDDFCRQVGRTANGGRPTPEPELAQAIQQVVDGLALDPGDHLLDLCCGNGLLTMRMATSCAWVTGVDFSAAMIEIARAHHASDKVAYVQASVLDLVPELFAAGTPFGKLCMFESLQYFRPDDLKRLLAGVCAVGTADIRCYFSGVLDKARLWDFFNTPERRAAYEHQQREGSEIMGYWWQRAEIEQVADEAGFSCAFFEQHAALNTAHYRFDAQLGRR